jgi:hypothetical protein
MRSTRSFNTHRLIGYKARMMDMLMRVTTLSVRTVAIVSTMKKIAR